MLLLSDRFFKVQLEIPLRITEDMHLPPKIVIMTATVLVETVLWNLKAPGGTMNATNPI